MELLEDILKRIEYGKNLEHDASRIFFYLEPSFRLALIDFLIRKHSDQVSHTLLIHLADYQLIKKFNDITDIDNAVKKQIEELHQAITDYRLIAFSKKHGVINEEIITKKADLKELNYYFDIVENIVRTLIKKL